MDAYSEDLRKRIVTPLLVWVRIRLQLVPMQAGSELTEPLEEAVDDLLFHVG
jgi:hypothetical protein